MKAYVWGGALCIIAIFPLFAPEYYIILGVQALIYGLLAMSLDVIMGYAGIVSFGHGAFFGIGAYTIGLSLIRGGFSFLSAIAMVIAASCAYGLLVGYFSSRIKDIYFAILTLAFAEVVYRIVFYSSFAGGSDGLIGIPRAPISIGSLSLVSLDTPLRYYYFSLIVLIASYYILKIIMGSPFGRVLKGIQENEDRMHFLGYRVNKYKILAFVISGVFAGLSGAMYSLFMGFADPEQLHFMLHGKIVIMVLLGGMGTLIGPIIGGAFVTIFEIIVSHYTQSFLLVVGATFIVAVIFMPQGILGITRKYWPEFGNKG